jgi:crotonobetainyl-CoA:carnitine CoA-transferase CaiB-like acyl-CoA transferase
LKGALEGIKVVELAESVAAPFCAKILADSGAEVIKFEPPGTGDVSRKRGLVYDDTSSTEKSELFLYLNSNKLSCTLNINSSGGREIFRRVVKDAFVLIEDKQPSLMQELELDYGHLSELNPGLVMASITPFGQTGPRRDYKGYYLNTFHSGVEGYITPGGSTFFDRPPINAAHFFGEYEAGAIAAGAVMIALYNRITHGQGQHVDISKQEALLSLNRPDHYRCFNGGSITTRFNRGWKLAGVIPCKDGYIEFCPNQDVEWTRLMELMGNPEWSQDEKFKNPASRQEHGAEAKQHIAEWLSQYNKEDICVQAQAKGIPFAPYRTVKETAESTQLKARGFFVEIDHPLAGRLEYPSVPYRFSSIQNMATKPAPLLGEHNKTVYYDRLGYTEEELVKLRASGDI